MTVSWIVSRCRATFGLSRGSFAWALSRTFYGNCLLASLLGHSYLLSPSLQQTERALLNGRNYLVVVNAKLALILCRVVQKMSCLPHTMSSKDVLSAAQGLPTLVGLIEDGFAENGHLTTIGVSCIWRILEMNVHGSLNHLCRLLSCAGLPHRLARALSAVNAEYTYAVSQV